MAGSDRQTEKLREAAERLERLRGKGEDEPGATYTTAQDSGGASAIARRPRKTSITPHERGRKQRMISFTFPSPGWTLAIRATAEALGLKPSEFATRVFAQALEAIERGEWDPETGTEWTPGEPESDDLWG